MIQSPRFSSRPLQWVAGDWQLAPIVGVHSVSFFTISTGVDSTLDGITPQRPNQVLPDPYCANRSYTCWLNAQAFSVQAPGTFGNLGSNNLVGPGYFDVDLALNRRFAVREKQYLEIRAEAFNIENRVNFLNPSNPGWSTMLPARR